MLVSYLKQLTGHKTIVSEFRRDLFDKELNVKLWKAIELAYYSTMIEEYGVKETTINTTCSKLRNSEKEVKRNSSRVLLKNKKKKGRKKKAREQTTG